MSATSEAICCLLWSPQLGSGAVLRAAQVVVLLCLLGVVALGVAGLVKLEAGVGRGCGWCQRVACVPTPWWACESALARQQLQQGAPAHAPAEAAGPGATVPGLLI